MRSSGVMRYVGRPKVVQTMRSELSLLSAFKVNHFSIGFMPCLTIFGLSRVQK